MSKFVTYLVLSLILVGTVFTVAAQKQNFPGGVGGGTNACSLTFPPPGTSVAGATYISCDPSHAAIHMTRTDNTFGTVLVLDNTATPGFAAQQNDHNEIDVNVDGQANYITLHWNGSAFVTSSILDLDQDNHFAIAAGGGGGIGTTPGNGNTCIPATTSPIAPSANAFCWNTSGQPSQSVGAPLAGIGQGVVVFHSTTTRNTNLSFTIPALNGGSNTTSAACVNSVGNCPSSVGLYEVISVFTVSVAGSASTLNVQVSYTDDVQAQSTKACTLTGPGGVGTAAQSMVNVGDTLTADCKFWSTANTNITLVWTFAGTTNPTVSAKTIMLSYGA